jgi:N-methylhydantoinase B/oxoprolinase/acetone carboxylase alpha subunit
MLSIIKCPDDGERLRDAEQNAAGEGAELSAKASANMRDTGISCNVAASQVGSSSTENASEAPRMVMTPDDEVTLETPGGGGYGVPNS